ncbi:MAG: hypothetical protein KA984_01780 [Candidatus Cloacimonetes bacterium]|nr:hypothetical protein [Candidatus Cloacimonadota bacterium]
MLTIDWKERLNQDTADYLENKLPKGDYDFEIIFNAYPERVNGKIPADVITHVAAGLLHGLGKKHADYLPFFRALWKKKGDYGKIAYAFILSKLLPKKPEIYTPLLDEALASADPHEITMLLDKVMLPLLRKHPEKYLEKAYAFCTAPQEELRKQGLNLMIKLLKKREDLIPQIMAHFAHQWHYPLQDGITGQVTLMKTVAKLDQNYYLKIWEEFGQSRDPQIVELLCATVLDYYPQLEAPIELWTKSGNARLKKAATTAQRVLLKKKGA